MWMLGGDHPLVTTSVGAAHAWRCRRRTHLEGYCSVFRFQPLDVSALDRRKISKTCDPIATTDTSGSPNTNTPFILRILEGKKKVFECN